TSPGRRLRRFRASSAHEMNSGGESRSSPSPARAPQNRRRRTRRKPTAGHPVILTTVDQLSVPLPEFQTASRARPERGIGNTTPLESRMQLTRQLRLHSPSKPVVWALLRPPPLVDYRTHEPIRVPAIDRAWNATAVPDSSRGTAG